MDCPQCEGALSTFTFDDREAFVCERCGYVGIEADHHGEPIEVESWTDALRRFHEEHEGDAVGGERTPVGHALDDATGGGEDAGSGGGSDSAGAGSDRDDPDGTTEGDASENDDPAA